MVSHGVSCDVTSRQLTGQLRRQLRPAYYVRCDVTFIKLTGQLTSFTLSYIEGQHGGQSQARECLIYLLNFATHSTEIL
jgi:hypothetical protein